MKLKRLLFMAVALVLIVGMLPTAFAQDTKAVTLSYPQELDTLNPMYTVMWFVGITGEIYLEGAWVFDDELNPVPRIAAEIPSAENGGISEDGKTITIKVREGATWSDGDPITSADFVFTYEMIMAPGNAPATRYPYDEFVTSVEAPDESTVVVNFNEPFAPWLATLFTYVLPEHVLRPVFEEEGTIDNAEWNRAPTVGSGPFVFDTWEVGSFMRFVRNENYYGDPAQLDVVVVTFVPDAESYVLGLELGEADLGTFIAYSDVPRLEETGVLSIEVVASGYNEAWFLNVNPETGHPALQDVNVRKALAMGFNRSQITEDLLLGLTYPAASFWENTPYASPNVEAIPYDPEGAAALLDEAGWVDSNGNGIRDKDGVELSLRYITNTRQIRQDTQVVAQQQLADIGVELVLENYPSDIYFNGYADGGPAATGQYDIAQWSATTSFPDPDTSRFRCDQIPSDENPTGANWTGYCNPELDALFDQQAVTTDPAARIAIYNQIDEMFSADVIWVGVWHDPDLWVYNQRVEGVRLNGADPFWNISTWAVR